MASFFEESLFFGMAVSLIAYGLGLLLKKKLKWAFLNPLLLSIIVVILFLQVLHVDYETYNSTARYLSYLLTPATVCLAIPLYQQLKLLKENLLAVVLGIVSGVIASMGGIFVLALAFGLNHEQYVTLLPKSITTAMRNGRFRGASRHHDDYGCRYHCHRCTGKCDRGAGLQDIPDSGAHRQRPGPWNLRPCHRHFQSPGTRRGGRSHEQPFDCGGRYSDCGRSVGLRESDSVRIS